MVVYPIDCISVLVQRDLQMIKVLLSYAILGLEKF